MLRVTATSCAVALPPACRFGPARTPASAALSLFAVLQHKSKSIIYSSIISRSHRHAS